ncbi:methyltransferase domain-containing protein [Paenibacillus sp. FSL W8-1187]|uniref:Ribosomal RNA adenine dimethylase n=1 Tax=Paenibacillus pasadenensis TaxID=217090 RepID=A0A2N5N3S3_9BACL|nr:methyltransferase domain-containing protein [Paenibacillus pasadenensis]PLT44995.1 Ribosomal RNA adenine dimethylase [Paenibacillus pasadenensis]
MSELSGYQQTLHFMQQFFESPKQVGSLVPSSRFLARKMAEAVPWEEIAAIAELGAGTGAITREISQRSKPSAQVLLFEKEKGMRERLARRFPDYRVFEDAGRLDFAMAQAGIASLDAILSGLPFFNFPRQMRKALLDQCFQALRPGGWLIAFQYSLQMRKPLGSLFAMDRIEFELRNFPPAFVYVCRKEENLPDSDKRAGESE